MEPLLTHLILGVTSKLAKLSQDHTVTHSSVSATAISTWAEFVSVVLSDSNFSTQMLTAPVILDPVIPIKDDGWLSDAQKQLCQHLSVFQKLTNHSDHRLECVMGYFFIKETILIN